MGLSGDIRTVQSKSPPDMSWRACHFILERTGDQDLIQHMIKPATDAGVLLFTGLSTHFSPQPQFSRVQAKSESNQVLISILYGVLTIQYG